jgi:hypothetical protein
MRDKQYPGCYPRVWTVPFGFYNNIIFISREQGINHQVVTSVLYKSARYVVILVIYDKTI